MDAFKIHIKDHIANKRLLQVKLKMDGHTPPVSDTSTGKAVDSKNIDQGYLLKKTFR
jgi:hypothetical protein